MENYKSSYGDVQITIENSTIGVKFLDNETASEPEAEIVAQEYLNENPEGGKFNKNEVGRAELSDGIFYAEIN